METPIEQRLRIVLGHMMEGNQVIFPDIGTVGISEDDDICVSLTSTQQGSIYLNTGMAFSEVVNQIKKIPEVEIIGIVSARTIEKSRNKR